MLVPAIALAWCVVSLPAKVTVPSDTTREHAVRAGVTAMQASAPTSLRGPAAPVDLDAYDLGKKTLTRAAIHGAIPASVIAFAKTLVNYPMGAQQATVIEGQQYLFVLERHYHPQGFVGAPNGWHKGVTAYELR